MNRILRAVIFLMFVLILSACRPEIGSEEWCEDMAETSKGDWTANEAAEFAKSCVFKKYDNN